MATAIPNKKNSKKLENLSLLDEPREVQSGPDSNIFYFGDNLNVCKFLLEKKKFKEKFKSIYLDPPFLKKGHFETKDNVFAFRDDMDEQTYIKTLRDLLLVLKELLNKNGSIFLHLDQEIMFEGKILMDKIFGKKNFKNLIIREKCNSKNTSTKKLGNVVDYILFYCKDQKYFEWNKPFQKITDEYLKKEYPFIDKKKGRYKKVPIHAPGIRNGETGKKWRGHFPPKGKHWMYTPSKLDEFDQKGEIYWSKNNNPRRIVYASKSKGVAISDIWLNFKDSINQNTYFTNYPTEKNLDLIKEIIKLSSNKGDFILDPFSGSGTTSVASQELERNCISIDDSKVSLKTIKDRYKKICSSDLFSTNKKIKILTFFK